jgi:hypothetical protein
VGEGEYSDETSKLQGVGESGYSDETSNLKGWGEANIVMKLQTSRGGARQI